jgi:ferredoxin
LPSRAAVDSGSAFQSTPLSVLDTTYFCARSMGSANGLVGLRHLDHRQLTTLGVEAAPARLPSPAVRLAVDLTLCQGYAQCAFLAPDVFRFVGNEALMYVPEPDESMRLNVLRAAAACPVGAVLVDVDDLSTAP